MRSDSDGASTLAVSPMPTEHHLLGSRVLPLLSLLVLLLPFWVLEERGRLIGRAVTVHSPSEAAWGVGRGTETARSGTPL